MKSQEEQELQAQVEQVRGRLQDLTADLRVVDDEVESLAPQRMHHELLDQACGSLEKLDELGAASLFWGDQIEPERIEEQLRGVRGRLSDFQAQFDELDERRGAILARIDGEEEILEILGEDIYYIREEEERRKLEWVVERDISPVPRRVQLMAWARGGEDDRRFRKSLGASLLVSLLLGALLPMIPLPLPKRFVPEEMPKRLAQLVRQEQAKLFTPPPVVDETPPERAETVRAAAGRTGLCRGAATHGRAGPVRAAVGDTGLWRAGARATTEGGQGRHLGIPGPVREPGKGRGCAASRSRRALR
jgi:hypothetical protein